jgi:hypothetical protein
MSEDIILSGPVAFMSNSGGAVFFSKGSAAAGTFQVSKGTATPVKEMQTALKVAYWGEDNRFPQNIEQQMAYCGVGKSALDWKAKTLWGSGIIPGKIVGYEDGGIKEVFDPLDRTKYKNVYSLIEKRSMYRFFLEYLQDWAWYFNCFPEVILSKDCKTITGLVHQESNDCRFKQMNDKGVIDTVYLSKLWGASRDQYAKFDPKKGMSGLITNPARINEVDNIYVKALDCIDMYDPLNSLKAIGDKQKNKKGDALRSAILPVNYPSPNKTYYQVPYWDGARLSGWVEIAVKIPSLLKQLYNKAFRIKYHIEVPETYFDKLYGAEKWQGMDENKQREARIKLLKEMDKFLTNTDDDSLKSFISFFDVDPIDKKESGRVKITAVEDKTSIDKELLASSAANIEILMAMQVHPTQFSAGMTGSMYRSGGGSGSDIRESDLVNTSKLHLERNVLLEPLYLIRDYNREIGGIAEWEEDIVFRIKDTVLTTLDTGKGTAKTVS